MNYFHLQSLNTDVLSAYLLRQIFHAVCRGQKGFNVYIKRERLR